MGKTSLDPIHQLDALSRAIPKRFEFTAKTPAAARGWQTKARKALAQTLGFLDQRRVPLAASQIECVDRGDYVREKIMLRTSRDSVMPTYLLIPNNHPKPMPSVLTLHGHGYGVRDIVGIRSDNTDRD